MTFCAPETVFVLGAGVDVPFGLPTMTGLVGELARFASGDGKPVHDALRKHAKGMRFSLEKHTGDEGERFAEGLLSNRAHLLAPIQSALAKHPDPDSEVIQAITKVVEQLDSINTSNQLDAETVRVLAHVGGEDGLGAEDDTLLDTRGIGLSAAPRQAMRRIFQGLIRDVPGLTDDEKTALGEMVAAVSNFEEMLGDFFSGFFTKSVANQKKYFYLSWLFWAFIRYRAAEGKANRENSLYPVLSEITNGDSIITFNYTDFFCDQTRPTTGYFHGDAGSYIRLDTREYAANDDVVRQAETVAAMAAFIQGLDTDFDAQRVHIPGIVPPLAVKPVICTEYLDRWYRCGEKIRAANRIVIIGYSFNLVDEHFNDLVRKNHGARVVLVNPQASAIEESVCRALAFDRGGLNDMTIAGLRCRKGRNVTFASAKAEELTADKIGALLRP
jgi:hypothetical protein